METTIRQIEELIFIRFHVIESMAFVLPVRISVCKMGHAKNRIHIKWTLEWLIKQMEKCQPFELNIGKHFNDIIRFNRHFFGEAI